MAITPGSTLDQSGALISMMLAKEAAGGGALTSADIPDGDYVLKQTIHARQFVSINLPNTDGVRFHFEDLGDTDIAFDLMGHGPSGGAHPADRRYSGISGFTILGGALATEASAVRLGHNHRSINLVSCINIKDFGGDGILHDGDNWNTKISNIQVHSSAFRKLGSAGWRMTDNVKSLNFLSADFITIEGCGNPELYTLVDGKKRYSAVSSGINLQGAADSTNRGWHLNMIEAENNFGLVEMLFGRLLDFVLTAPYVEALPGVLVGIEMSNSNGTIITPCLNAEPGTYSVSPDKAMKFYGNSNVVISSYRRGSGWVTNDIETADASKVTVLGGQNIRTQKYGTSEIVSI